MPLSKEQLTAYIKILDDDRKLHFRSDMTPFAIAILKDYVITHAGLDLPRPFDDEYLDNIKNWNNPSYKPLEKKDNNGKED